jgi:hypothetical protein
VERHSGQPPGRDDKQRDEQCSADLKREAHGERPPVVGAEIRVREEFLPILFAGSLWPSTEILRDENPVAGRDLDADALALPVRGKYVFAVPGTLHPAFHCLAGKDSRKTAIFASLAWLDKQTRQLPPLWAILASFISLILHHLPATSPD